MSFFDDNYEYFIGEEELYREFLEYEEEYRAEVKNFIQQYSNQELLMAARKVLHRINPDSHDYDEDMFLAKVRSIITYGIAYQKFSDKQRYVLGDFILMNT